MSGQGADAGRTGPVRRVMRGRDPREEHRAATPLELLFDLTFVVAVSQAAAQLHHALAEGHLGDGLAAYAAVFFSIWWAWMNFTWFASAYDTDDVPYRLLTLLQMAGVLVLAAGVPAVFEDNDFTVVVIGYVIMRVALLSQWLRAAAEHPEDRSGALGTPQASPWCRFAIGALLLVFALWWIYFTGSDARLTTLRTALAWGYGHYAVFAALAAIGSGLEVALYAIEHHGQLSMRGAGLAVAVPVAIALPILGLLHRMTGAVGHALLVPTGALVVLALGFSAPALGVGGAVLGMGLAVSATLAANLFVIRHRHTKRR
ncbi:low temperature requirement protein A [Streptomyces scopuliridis]|uniref:low temperature requirement protein A n=1 Tax=Streptomyces scopuliridis TaxID=452529 RepID=UPI00369AEFFF